MKSWVVYNNRFLWEVYDTEDEARKVAAKYGDCKVRGFHFGEGDKVIDKAGNILTIVRPATSVTGAYGYKVSGGKWDFLDEDDIESVVPTSPWKEWVAHLVQVAVTIAEERRDLTEDEYKAYEREGGGDIVDDFYDNLTEEDAVDFVKWARGIAARK